MIWPLPLQHDHWHFTTSAFRHLAWDPTTDPMEFENIIIIPNDLLPAVHTELTSVIQDNWDCFYTASVHCPIRGFVFASILVQPNLSHTANPTMAYMKNQLCNPTLTTFSTKVGPALAEAPRAPKLSLPQPPHHSCSHASTPHCHLPQTPCISHQLSCLHHP